MGFVRLEGDLACEEVSGIGCFDRLFGWRVLLVGVRGSEVERERDSAVMVGDHGGAVGEMHLLARSEAGGGGDGLKTRSGQSDAARGGVGDVEEFGRSVGVG